MSENKVLNQFRAVVEMTLILVYFVLQILPIICSSYSSYYLLSLIYVICTTFPPFFIWRSVYPSYHYIFFILCSISHRFICYFSQIFHFSCLQWYLCFTLICPCFRAQYIEDTCHSEFRIFRLKFPWINTIKLIFFLY